MPTFWRWLDHLLAALVHPVLDCSVARGFLRLRRRRDVPRNRADMHGSAVQLRRYDPVVWGHGGPLRRPAFGNDKVAELLDIIVCNGEAGRMELFDVSHQVSALTFLASGQVGYVTVYSLLRCVRYDLFSVDVSSFHWKASLGHGDCYMLRYTLA